MSIFNFFAAMVFALLSLPLVACGGGDPNSMDKLTFERTKLDANEANWTGEVVRSEKLGQNLYKVLVKWTGGEKMDTLFATTELPIGMKVRYVTVVMQSERTGMPSTTRFAFPIEPGK